jgi:hypothetical protein
MALECIANAPFLATEMLYEGIWNTDRALRSCNGPLHLPQPVRPEQNLTFWCLNGLLRGKARRFFSPQPAVKPVAR